MLNHITLGELIIFTIYHIIYSKPNLFYWPLYQNQPKTNTLSVCKILPVFVELFSVILLVWSTYNNIKFNTYYREFKVRKLFCYYCTCCVNGYNVKFSLMYLTLCLRLYVRIRFLAKLLANAW